jgi:hypothetical protein
MVCFDGAHSRAALDETRPAMTATTTRCRLPLLLALAGCAPGSAQLPLLSTPTTAPELTLVWVGRGECERFENGAWVRRPEFDYDFSVEQRRDGAQWNSVKSMRRRHPDYDGSAGERSQTYFFKLDFAPPDAQAKVAATVATSLGDGTGVTDREFRSAVLDFKANVSRFAPFDRYRITQRYDYEGGQLTELVELNKGQNAWVRNREVAQLFAQRSFATAPTVR